MNGDWSNEINLVSRDGPLWDRHGWPNDGGHMMMANLLRLNILNELCWRIRHRLRKIMSSGGLFTSIRIVGQRINLSFKASLIPVAILVWVLFCFLFSIDLERTYYFASKKAFSGLTCIPGQSGDKIT